MEHRVRQIGEDLAPVLQIAAGELANHERRAKHNAFIQETCELLDGFYDAHFKDGRFLEMTQSLR